MLRVVIAEDEEIIRQGLVQTIDWPALGAEIVGAAADGREAADLVVEKSADVLLADICMPRMTGLETARELKRRSPGTRVVLLTSYADFSYAQEAIRVGVEDYLLKPIRQEELLRVFSALQENEEVCMGEQNPYVRAAKEAIASRYAERLSVERIAEEQGISASYLSRKLKEAEGKTFGELLTEKRLFCAEELIAAGRLRMYEIALATGFGEYKNFAQTYKKYRGFAPKDFRRRQEDV